MEYQCAPQLYMINGLEMHIPESMRGGMHVPSTRECIFKMHSYLGLRHFLREGGTVLDAGCSHGVMGVLISNIVGSAGAYHALDADGAAIAEARQLIKENEIDGAVSVHNLAVGESTGEAEFRIVQRTRGFWPTGGQEEPARSEKVRAVTIDGYCETAGISPDCIKLDVGGSECLAIRGAKDTIERCAPDFVIETHGRRIAGSLAELTSALESRGYGLFDMFKRDRVSAGQYASEYLRGRSTLLASTRLGDAAAIRQEIEDWKARHFAWFELMRRPEAAPRVLWS